MIRSKVPNKAFNEGYDRIFGNKKVDRKTFEYPQIDNSKPHPIDAEPDNYFNRETGN